MINRRFTQQIIGLPFCKRELNLVTIRVLSAGNLFSAIKMKSTVAIKSALILGFLVTLLDFTLAGTPGYADLGDTKGKQLVLDYRVIIYEAISKFRHFVWGNLTVFSYYRLKATFSYAYI